MTARDLEPLPPEAGTQMHDDAYREMIEHIPQIVYLADADGVSQYFNQQWYEYTGAIPGASTADAWVTLVPPDDLDIIMRAWDHARATGTPFEAEYRLRRADGMYRWHLGRSVPMRDTAGAVTHWVGTATDIDDRKRAEAQAIEAEERLRFLAALTQNVADAVISTDSAFRIVTWNRGAEAMYGWTAAEVIGQPSAEIIPVDYAIDGSTRPQMLETLTTQGEWRGEVFQPRKNGERLAVLSTVTRVTDDNGHVIGYTAINRDITDRRRTEENLRFLADASKTLASSLDYRTTLAAVAQLGVPRIADWCAVEMRADDGSIQQVAVAHVDPEKVRWARALNQANPTDPDAPSGVPNVLRTGKAEFYPDIPDELLVASANNDEELALLRKVGMSSVIIAPMHIGDRTIGAISFVATESGRHFSAIDLAMAEEVGARAALAVENARLYTASQHALSIRDDFISLASHELKTPVTSLKMYSQTLERQFERRGETVVAERLRKMNAQIDKLTGLINDLLDVTRITQGRLTFREAEYDLGLVVGEAIEQIQATTSKHTVRREGMIAAPLWGDRERIGQVMTNLLANAVKYSPQADTVVVRLRDAPDAVEVQVQDFGIGIAEEHQHAIFTQFYRVSDPEEKTYPGLGLGLYIAQDIVQRHDGTIRVESAKGHGATFSVVLPRTRARS